MNRSDRVIPKLFELGQFANTSNPLLEGKKRYLDEPRKSIQHSNVMTDNYRYTSSSPKGQLNNDADSALSNTR